MFTVRETSVRITAADCKAPISQQRHKLECSVTTIMDPDGQGYFSIYSLTKTPLFKIQSSSWEVVLGYFHSEKDETVLVWTPEHRLHPICSKTWAELSKNLGSFTSQSTNINQHGHLINISKGDNNTQKPQQKTRQQTCVTNSKATLPKCSAQWYLHRFIYIKTALSSKSNPEKNNLLFTHFIIQ